MTMHNRHLWKIASGWPGVCAVAALLWWLGAAPAAPYGGSDPVEDLRQALKAPLDPRIKEDVEFRQSELDKRIKALRPAQYGRALALEEWKDQDKELEVAAIDSKIRTALLKDFTDWVGGVLKPSQGNDTLRLATIAMLGEMGVKVRSDSQEKPLARELTPALVPLLDDANPLLRQAAARSLGKINPDPKPATEALGKLLASSNLEDRRAAADGLVALLKTTVPLLKARSSVGPKVGTAEVIPLATTVTNAIAPALRDRNEDIKKLGLEGVQLAAYLYGELLRDLGTETFPPVGRKLTAEDQRKIKDYEGRVAEDVKLFQPLSEALDKQAAAVAAILGDPRTEMRLLAGNTLGQIAFAQEQLLRRAGSVPRVEDKGAAPGAAALLDTDLQQVVLRQAKEAAEGGLSDHGLPALLKALRDPDARVRLSALEALYALGRHAERSTPAVLQALTDPNHFVRWVAVRFLGRYGQPSKLEVIVQALAPLLTDPDLDVQLATTGALGLYGKTAAPAAPDLSRQIQSGDARIADYVWNWPPATGTQRRLENIGDAEMRIAYMRTLQTTGVANEAALKLAVEALVTALKNRDSRVRIAAADALAQFGPKAKEAAPALEAALEDQDPDLEKRNLVRQAASNALLAVAGEK